MARLDHNCEPPNVWEFLDTKPEQYTWFCPICGQEYAVWKYGQKRWWERMNEYTIHDVPLAANVCSGSTIGIQTDPWLG